MIGLLGVLLAPSTASAIEVMCQNEMGVTCTLSNDPEQSYECTCDGELIEGTTGGSMNPWADFTEVELLDTCYDVLPDECPTGDSTTSADSGGSEGTGPVTGTPDTNPTTDPSGGESSGGESDDDDDDKGCSIGTREHALSPWLAVLVACAWRRRGRR